MSDALSAAEAYTAARADLERFLEPARPAVQKFGPVTAAVHITRAIMDEPSWDRDLLAAIAAVAITRLVQLQPESQTASDAAEEVLLVERVAEALYIAEADRVEIADARRWEWLDGTQWSAQEQAAAGVCVWHRDGRTWRRGCEDRPADTPEPTSAKLARARRGKSGRKR